MQAVVKRWKSRVLVTIWLSGAWCVLPGKEAAADAPPAAAQEFQQGRTCFAQSRYVDAAAHLEKACQLAPGVSLYAQWLGRAYGLEAQHASLLAKPGLAGKARDALAHAVALDPDNLGARSDLAAYYAAAPVFMGGGAGKAQTQVAEIRKRDPYLGQVRTGDLLWDNDRFAEAEKEYLGAVRIDPKRPEARGRLGSYYTEHGHYPQAFEQWDAILAANPREPHALFGLGKTAAFSGQREGEGVAALQVFLKGPKPEAEGPPPARAHCYLGVLLAKRGDVAGARAAFQQALRLNPNLDEAKQGLAKLGK